MSDTGKYVAVLGVSGVLLWSALEDRKITYTLQQVLQGRKPIPGVQVPMQPAGIGTTITSPVLPAGAASGLAADALRYNGAGYVFGGKPALGIGQWDCSSFSNWCAGHDTGLPIPGYPAGSYNGSVHGPIAAQWLVWSGLVTVGHNGNVAQAGDLACWPTHMGICIGPNQMISAQNPVDGTKVSVINGFIPEPLSIRRYR